MNGFTIVAVGGVVLCLIGFAVSRKNPTFLNTVIMPAVVGVVIMIGLYLLQ